MSDITKETAEAILRCLGDDANCFRSYPVSTADLRNLARAYLDIHEVLESGYGLSYPKNRIKRRTLAAPDESKFTI